MKLRRSISTWGLLSAAVGGIVGSGWLFGPMYATEVAGPAAIISWALGGILILFIAFTFAELSTTYPRAGGMVVFADMSHGPVLSFTIGWVIWLGSVVVAPVETLALLQYAGNYFPFLIEKSGHITLLSNTGIGCSVLLMAVIVFLNTLGAKFFNKSTVLIVTIKIGVPILTLVVFFYMHFNVENFTAHGGFAPFGLHGIVAALPLGGIIFSFIGFSPAIQLAGEAENPAVAIPIAIIGGISLCVLLYILLQISFIGSLKASYFMHGWSQLSFPGDSGPIAGILGALGIGWLMYIVYAGSFISPFGTAFIYTASTSRVAYAMGEIGFFAKIIKKLNKKGIPFNAMILNYCVGIIVFLPFHQWQTMVEFLMSCFLMAFSVGPISLAMLRKKDVTTKRPFRLPAYHLICLIAFYVCNLLLFWSGWKIIEKLMMVLGFGFLVLLYRVFRDTSGRWKGQWQQSWWLLPYILGIAILTYLGSFAGGENILHFGPDFFVIAVFSVVIYSLAHRVEQRKK